MATAELETRMTTATHAPREVRAAPWFKDAIIYQVHVRAFQDSNNDGVGDFRGLMSRLDYIQDLGVTAIWLQPFFPSPLRDDGYDIADYRNVNSQYGTLEDFQAFLEEAHRRDLRVITELVMNHTSDQHEWFQHSRKAALGSPWRDWYVWSETPDKYQEARIIFQDFESSNWSWDPVAGAYFWHRFYSHQPDLNFDNPAVGDAMIEVLDFWLEMGVDGCGWMRCRTCSSARGRIAKTCPRRTRFCGGCGRTSTKNLATRCCWRKPISGRRMRPRILATAMNAT
jgi:maltose alpha-D-glucosyltransferase/alpha-amylase